MKDTKKMRKITSIPPAHSESAENAQEPGSQELFAKDLLRPLRSSSQTDHHRLVKIPTDIPLEEADKTTRSLPKTKA